MSLNLLKTIPGEWRMKMRILITLITLITFALSASLAVARDANRESLRQIESQQHSINQHWEAYMAKPGGSWTGSQSPYVGPNPYATPDALKFFGS
jgi:hypothetical protein